MVEPDDADLAEEPSGAPLFRAVVNHALGQTRSDPMTGLLTLRVAKAWHARGDRVMIEGADGFGQWTVPEFEKVVFNLLA